MSPAELARANVENLTGLWKHMGAERHALDENTGVYVSREWPDRLWLDWDCCTAGECITSLLGQLVPGCIVPVWPAQPAVVREALLAQGFRVLFSQTAMVMSLCEARIEAVCDRLQFKQVCLPGDIQTWARVASSAFSYTVPPSVIEGLQDTAGVRIVLAFLNAEPVGTGLVFEHAGVTGLHLVGVLPSHRRQGLAREIMRYLLMLSRELASDYVTLQASQMGQALYRQLGFEKQFVLDNYSNGR